MNIRILLSILLIAVAVGIFYFQDDLLGGLLGSLVLVLMLLMWIIPAEAFRRVRSGEPPDPSITRISRMTLGIGLGLIGAALVGLFAPQWMDELLIGVGIVMLLWFVAVRLR